MLCSPSAHASPPSSVRALGTLGLADLHAKVASKAEASRAPRQAGASWRVIATHGSLRGTRTAGSPLDNAGIVGLEPDLLQQTKGREWRRATCRLQKLMRRPANQQQSTQQGSSHRPWHIMHHMACQRLKPVPPFRVQCRRERPNSPWRHAACGSQVEQPRHPTVRTLLRILLAMMIPGSRASWLPCMRGNSPQKTCPSCTCAQVRPPALPPVPAHLRLHLPFPFGACPAHVVPELQQGMSKPWLPSRPAPLR